MERNSFECDGFCITPVTDFSIFTGVSSFAGDEDIDDFILHDAEHHYERKLAVIYSLKTLDHPDILAFASLQNDAIKLKKGCDDFSYTSFPAVKIGRLGVKSAFQRNGIGSIFINIITKFMGYANRTGCRFITLDAYNCERTINFYLKNGFSFLKENALKSGGHTIPMYRDLL